MAGIAYWGSKLVTDLVSDIKKGNFSKYPSYVERPSDQIGYKKPFQPSKSMPARRNFGPTGSSKRKYSSSYVRSSNKKRKRTYVKKTSYKKKKYTKKTTKKKGGPLSITPGTSRHRVARHDELSKTDCAYAAFSSIGERSKQMRCFAEAILLYYMNKVGDIRSTAHAGHEDPSWHVMAFHFNDKNTAASGSEYEDFINSRELVGGVSYTGAVVPLTNLSTELATILRDQAKRGKHLTKVVISRMDQTNHADSGDYVPRIVYTDYGAGNNVMSFYCKSVLKLQNTTEADFASDKANLLNIHRNPLDGYSYTFRNQVPLFRTQFLASQEDSNRVVLEDMNNCDSSRIGGVHVPELTTLPRDIPEFKIPTNTPSVMFRNSVGKKKTSIQPGSHRSYYLTESYTGTVNQYFDRYVHVAESHGDNQGNIPPGGTCMLIGLKPTYRTSSAEDIKLQVEHDVFYMHRLSQGKKSILPIYNRVI